MIPPQHLHNNRGRPQHPISALLQLEGLGLQAQPFQRLFCSNAAGKSKCEQPTRGSYARCRPPCATGRAQQRIRPTPRRYKACSHDTSAIVGINLGS
jgi:hypothetical protein